MPALSKRFVESAPPGIYYDGRLPGFGLRVGRSGVRSFFVEYRPGRGPKVDKRRFTFARYGAPAPDGSTWTAERARVEALKLLGRIRTGWDPLDERARAEEERRRCRPTVAEVAEWWLERDQRDKRSFAEHARIVRRYVVPAIGHVPLADLSRTDVLELVEDIAERAPVMANRVFSRLRRMCRWAVNRGLLAHDPTAGLERPAPETSRDRVLEDAELAWVWRAAEAMGFPYGAIVRLLVLTGCRRGEIGALRWEEVKDLDGAEPRIELAGSRTKTGAGRTVPLSQPAAAILRALPRSAGPFVFGRAGAGPFEGWSKGKRQLDAKVAELSGAPLAPWRLHDLRRTCATGLQRLGVRLEVTEAVLGHVSGSRGGIVGVYQRWGYEPEKRRALEAWARHVTTVVGCRDAGPVDDREGAGVAAGP